MVATDEDSTDEEAVSEVDGSSPRPSMANRRSGSIPCSKADVPVFRLSEEVAEALPELGVITM